MARAYCNGKLIDVWNKEWQERTVEEHGFNYQKTQGRCPDPDYTFEETYGDDKKYVIKN